jgi:DNA (cytosine-5)-methyltransferase 1
MTLRYLSVCSGIEAASVAWRPYAFEPVAFAEIEAFPSAVLAHHYPLVPNWGDLTRFREWPDADVDVLVGGTPCQSFSVAGLRRGLDDPRGNLALTYLAVADRYRPEWLVWENVPGVLSSSGGRDFGSFLGGLVELGYGFAYRVLDAQYVRVDGFGRAVPQRRRRVFVVGNSRDWRRAAAVLFERESLSGNPPPRREAGQGAAGAIARSVALRGRDGGGTAELGDDLADTIRASSGGGDKAHALVAAEVAAVLETTSHDYSRADGFNMIAHALRADGFDASEDGTGRGTPLVPIAFDTTQITSKANRSNPQPGDPSHPLAAEAHAPAIAWSIMPQNSGRDFKARAVEVSQPIMAGGPVGGNQGGDYIQRGWAVRRLTPSECERLQGFPDGYTLVLFCKKPAADGPRYKALGNSMAVNVMRWIGGRIDMANRVLAA